jgi:hypothetical protein
VRSKSFLGLRPTSPMGPALLQSVVAGSAAPIWAQSTALPLAAKMLPCSLSGVRPLLLGPRLRRLARAEAAASSP